MNAIQKQMLSTLALAVACVQLVSAAAADPIHGRDVLKFSQKPMDGTVIPASALGLGDPAPPGFAAVRRSRR